MNKSISVILCALCAFAIAIPYYDDAKEYYWRRYTGAIPSDAVAGGRTNQDATTYIGQVYFEGAIIPAEIRPNQSNVYFVWNGPKFTTDNIKILCSPNPEKFEWIKVNEKNFRYLWNKHIVMGGFHLPENRAWLIGRISHQNKGLVVGEVLELDKEIRIWYAVDGTEVSVANTDMELLSYNPYLPVGNVATVQDNLLEGKHTIKANSSCLEKIFNMSFN